MFKKSPEIKAATQCCYFPKYIALGKQYTITNSSCKLEWSMWMPKVQGLWNACIWVWQKALCGFEESKSRRKRIMVGRFYGSIVFGNCRANKLQCMFQRKKQILIKESCVKSNWTELAFWKVPPSCLEAVLYFYWERSYFGCKQ